MRRKILIYCLLLITTLQAQPPSKFNCVFGGNGDDVAYCCKQTLDGNYIFVGSSSSSGQGQTDIYLLKVSSFGQLMWEKYIGGFGNEIGRSIILLGDSGFIIGGFTSSFGNGGYDAFAVRTDKNGNVIWQSTFGSTDWDFGNSLVTCADGNFILAGSSYSNTNQKQDGYAVKFTPSGIALWQKFYGGLENDEIRSIISNDGQTFYMAGLTSSYGELNGDMYGIKINSNGDTLFTVKYGSSQLDFANDVVCNANNDFILAGAITYSTQKTDAAFVKFDANQNKLWEKNYGLGTENEECFKIIESAHPVAANFVAIYTSYEIAGYNKDTKTIYFNNSGDYFGGLFSGSFGFEKDDEIFYISETTDLGYISCGYTNSFSSGNKDVWIIKRDSVLNNGPSIVGIDNDHSFTEDKSSYLFPNPILKEQRWLTIHSEEQHFGDFDAIAVDVLGRSIKLDVSIEDRKIDIKGLEPGYYVITVHYSSKEQKFSLIIR